MSLKEEIISSLGIEPSLLIAHIIATVIILVLLYFFVWKKAVLFIEKREKKIRDDIESALEMNRQAKLNAQNMAIELENATVKATEIINDAKTSANEKRNQILEKARKDADNLISSTKIMISTEKKMQKQKYEKEAINAAFTLSQELLEREIKTSDHKELINSFIKDLENKDEE